MPHWKPEALLEIVEAIYRLETPEEDWVIGILEALTTAFGPDRGVAGVLYDASDGAEQLGKRLCNLGTSAEWAEAGAMMHDSPDFAPVARMGYRSILTAAAREFPPERVDALLEQMQQCGLRDQFILNGIDASHRGFAAYLFSSRELHFSPARRDALARIATHLATAYRLRRRLDAAATSRHAGVEAVLRTDGRIEHAEGPARERAALDGLCDAVQRRELVRAGRHDAARALVQWRAMVHGRWTLVDEWQGGGSRYVLARENTPHGPGLAKLSSREQQVVSLAALGRSNKLIAYELGLAHSTVRVLMARAASKLGLPSRDELVAHARQHQTAESQGAA